MGQVWRGHPAHAQRPTGRPPTCARRTGPRVLTVSWPVS